MPRKELPSVYYTRHQRVRAARGRAVDQICVKCGRRAEDWAQIHGTEGESPDDYQPMCTSCHMRYDKGIPDGVCGNGHLLTEENTWWRGTKRVCKDCATEAVRRYQERHRDEVNARQREKRGTTNPCPPDCTCWRHGNNGAAQRARAALLENHERSNPAISQAIGVSTVTVWKVRAELERTGEIGRFWASRSGGPRKKG